MHRVTFMQGDWSSVGHRCQSLPSAGSAVA
jgi:hypothetical protein